MNCLAIFTFLICVYLVGCCIYLLFFLAHTQDIKDCLSLSSAIALDAWVCYKTIVYFWSLMCGH